MYALYNIFLCVIYSTLIVVIFLFVLSYFIRSRKVSSILWNMKLCWFPLLIFFIISFAFIIMIRTFNNGEFFIGTHTEIPVDISKWGNFAAFFGGIFALVSIFLTYLAFMSQANSSRRTSFDATFTQMFAQHNVLRERVVRHNIGVGMDIFQYCVKYFEKNYISFETTATSSDKLTPSAVDEDISTLWDDFNKKNNIKDVSVDFKNYFKYIYHEINIIVCQQDEVLNDNARQNYVQLIQAQMNYDELFCYFINQVEYLIHWRKIRSGRIPDNVVRHAENLRCYKFFEELCRSRSGHVPLIRNVMEKHKFEVLMLINDDWFY